MTEGFRLQGHRPAHTMNAWVCDIFDSICASRGLVYWPIRGQGAEFRDQSLNGGEPFAFKAVSWVNTEKNTEWDIGGFVSALIDSMVSGFKRPVLVWRERPAIDLHPTDDGDVSVNFYARLGVVELNNE